ncbi:hypothetical protein ACWGVR_10510 [Streptomyces xanthophaeus]
MTEVSRYRFLRGGVGLAVDISAEVREIAGVPAGALQIYRNVYLHLPAGPLPWKDASWLSFGLSLHADLLAVADQGSSRVVDVTSLDYPNGDYRAEVAALAIDCWLHRYLDFPACGASVAYDRESHEFSFSWPDGVTPFADDLP